MALDISKYRKTEYDIDQIFVNRWSPRTMSGEELTDKELMPLFEAARWAPSTYNAQEWRFIYAKRNTKHWDTIFNLLMDPNKVWCKNAAVLLVIISKRTFEFNGKSNPVHSFDCGSAWENLALEGTRRGLVVHGMAGFDYDKAKKDLNVPDDYKVEAMAAIGKLGKIEDLPEPLQKIEFPSDRKKISEIIMEGEFRG